MPSSSAASTSSSLSPSPPRRITRSSTRASKLRRASPEELEDYYVGSSYGASLSGSESEEEFAQPVKIDEPWPYMFQTGDKVWIRTAGGNWHRGRVSRQTTRKGVIRRRDAEGFFYSVVFNDKLRKYFAPLNGDIKPDNRHTRELLGEAGLL